MYSLAPHGTGEYETIQYQKKKGVPDELENYLYLNNASLYGTEYNSKEIDKNTFKNPYAFFCSDVFPDEKPFLNVDNTAKYRDYFCDMSGKKVVPTAGYNIIGIGLFNTKFCYFWLENQVFYVKYMKQILVVPFDHVYVKLSSPGHHGDDPFQIRRLDSVYREIVKGLPLDLEYDNKVFELSLHIFHINQKYEPLLEDEIRKNTQSLLIEEVEIKCTDGSFMFYPPDIKAIPKKSIFNKTQFQQKSISLDFDVDDVKQIFSIYVSDKLPDSLMLIRGGLLAICYGVTNYLGIEFWENYYGEIVHHISFIKIVIPSQGSVNDYIELLEGLNLQEAYKELYSSVQCVEFYIALERLGLSRRFMRKSRAYNRSPYLMKFLGLD